LDTLSLCEEDFIEVVVADDGSSENIVSELNKVILNYRFPIIHVWQPKEGFRLAASRNNGIKNSTGDYLNFLDCDFLVLPGAIKRHKEVAKHGRYVAGFLKYLTAEQSLALLKMEISPERLESLYRQLPNKTLIREHHRFIRYVLLRKLRLANIGTVNLIV
jgi:glycosyltransferase involved in cell wall biosynthesis